MSLIQLDWLDVRQYLYIYFGNKTKMIGNNAYYQFNFQPGYVQLNEKIQTLTNDALRTQINELEEPQYLYDTIRQQIEYYDLEFNPSKIYSTPASIHQLNESLKRGPSQLCPNCGDQIKKQFLCQFCAQIFCKNCCWRKRVIPFNTKESQPKNCCEDCHKKFIKLMANQKFYADKELLVKVIDFTKGKYDKAEAKKAKLDDELNEFQQIKKNDQIKEKNLLQQIAQMEQEVKETQQKLQIAKAEKKKRQEEKRKIKLQKEKKQQQRKQRQAEQAKLKKQNSPQKKENLNQEKQIIQQKNQNQSQKRSSQKPKLNQAKIQEKVEKSDKKIQQKIEEEKVQKKEEITTESQKEKDSQNQSQPLNVKQMSMNELLSYSVNMSPQITRKLSRRDSQRQSRQSMKERIQNYSEPMVDSPAFENQSQKTDEQILNMKHEVLRNSSLITSTKGEEQTVIDNKKCTCNVM